MCDFVKSRVRRWTIAGWWCMASLNTWVSPAVALVLIGTKMFRWFMFTVFGKKVILKIFILVKQGTLDRSSVPCCQSGCWPWPEHQRVTLLFSYWYIWPSGMKRDKFLSILLPYSPTRPCALFSGIGGVAFSSLGRSSGSLCKHQTVKNVSTQDQMNANWFPAIVIQLAGQNFSCCKPSHRQFALRWENLTQGTLHVFFFSFFSKHTPTHLASQLALHILIVGLFQEHAEILWSNGMFAVDHSRCNCFLPRITLFIESEDKGFTTSKTKGYFGNSAMFVHNMVQSEKIHIVLQYSCQKSSIGQKDYQHMTSSPRVRRGRAASSSLTVCGLPS